MSAKQLMIEMVVALLLATFAMSLDDVHANASQDANRGKSTCQQRLPALAGSTERLDNLSPEGRSISDESQACASTDDPAKPNSKDNDWLRLLP